MTIFVLLSFASILALCISFGFSKPSREEPTESRE